MSSTEFTGNRTRLAKSAILLVIALGLFAFVEMFSPLSIFESQSTGWKLWFSYAKDLSLPFAFYFLLCLGEKWLQSWQMRAFVSFAVFALMEFAQLLYYRVFTGRYVGSFDPLDILAYALSVGLAVLIEQKVFPRFLKFW